MKFFFLLVLVGACSSNQGALSEKAKELEVLGRKPTDCQVVGKVVGNDKNGSTELALNDALNKAAKLNASAIFVNQEVPNGNARAVHATAYKCE